MLRRVLVTSCLLAALVVAGCSGDGGSGKTARTTTTSSRNAPRNRAVTIAHRGASGYAPEHTFASYDLALEQGADYIEQDVQTTADGVLVVLHDDTLDRTARGPADSCTGPVTAKTLRQIETCDVGSWFNEAHPDRANPKFVGLRIPTMEQILRRYGSQARYYAEIKSPAAQPGIEQKLIDLFERSGALARPASDHAIVVQSFSAESLQRVHALRPDIPLVQLVPIRADAAALDGYRAYAAGIGPSSETVDAALVQAAHERCLAVHPYTVDDPAEMTGLLGIGIDGLFTDVPDRFAAAREASSPAARPAGCGENGLLTGR